MSFFASLLTGPKGQMTPEAVFELLKPLATAHCHDMLLSRGPALFEVQFKFGIPHSDVVLAFGVERDNHSQDLWHLTIEREMPRSYRLLGEQLAALARANTFFLKLKEQMGQNLLIGY